MVFQHTLIHFQKKKDEFLYLNLIDTNFFTGTYELSFSFDTFYIWLRSTNEMCMHNVQQRPLLEFDSHDRNTLNHIHPHRMMYYYIDGRSFPECQVEHFSYRNSANYRSTLNLCLLVVCDLDSMASIGNCIWEWASKKKKMKFKN